MAGTQPPLSDVQIAGYAWQAFGDLGDQVVIQMTAFALAESSGIPDNKSPGFTAGGEGAGGLWQIQNNHSESDLGIPGFWSAGLWAQPYYNARAARKVYNSQGYGAWSVSGQGNNSDVNNSYAQFLPRAQQAVAQVKAGGAPAVPAGGVGATPGSGLSHDGSSETTTIVGGKIPDLVNGLLSGLGPALWIGGGVLLVVLALIEMNSGTIASVAKVAAL